MMRVLTRVATTRRLPVSESSKMPRLAYVDGRIVPLNTAAVSVEDRGFQFADGVYEVCAVLNAQLLDWPQHLARLARNLSALAIAEPMTGAALTLVARRLLAANRAREALLYIQVTRGVAKRDHAFPTGIRPTLVITVRPFDFAQRVAQQAAGVSVVTVADQRWGRCDIKTTGLLANVLAKQAAREHRAFEAVLIGADGVVAEGSSTNIWAVEDGTLVTPPLSPRILPGVMRDTVLRLARADGIAVVERALTLAQAHAATELLLTSTTAPVLPVTMLDGTPIGSGRPGAVAARLGTLLWQEIDRQTGYRPG